MARSDFIADGLTVIRNGIQRGKKVVEIDKSNLLKEIIQIFKQEGFIKDFREIKDNKSGKLRVYLRYDSNGDNFISGIKRISKPGLRVYKNSSEIPKVLNGLGTCVLTTSKGVLSGEKARSMGIGGEVVCYIW